MTQPSLKSELTKALDEHDALLARCVAGELSFVEFLAAYNDFYWKYALDGHEATPESRTVFAELEPRIAVHRSVALDVLSRVCTEDEALLEAFSQSGRIGPVEAVSMLREIASGVGRPGIGA